MRSCCAWTSRLVRYSYSLLIDSTGATWSCRAGGYIDRPFTIELVPHASPTRWSNFVALFLSTSAGVTARPHANNRLCPKSFIGWHDGEMRSVGLVLDSDRSQRRRRAAQTVCEVDSVVPYVAKIRPRGVGGVNTSGSDSSEESPNH